MRSAIHTSLFLFAILATSFQGKAQSPTAPALDFNVFLENGARLVNNETEGPMALGGDLTVDGGYQVSINNPGTFYVGGTRVTLVVGGRVIYQSGTLQVNQSGYIKIGNCIGSTVWYTDPNGAYPPIRITPNSNYNSSPRIHMQVGANTLGVSAAINPVCQPNVIDFASAFATLRSHSVVMKNIPDNATITNSSGTIIAHTGLPSQVRITLNLGLNVLNLSGADMNAMSELTFNNHPDATHFLIVNVNAPGSFTWNVYNSAGIGFSNCPYILYNFYNTTALSIAGGGAIEGTVYAPNADITKTANMANIEGQIIAKSYHHAGGENHYALFAPFIPGCGGPITTSPSYTVNIDTQCLDAHTFVFSNTSTGTGPFTYLWNFGDGTTSTSENPLKMYTAVGTYNVKLKVTAAGGTDSVTHTVTVAGNPAYGFTINDTVQELTGNSYEFYSTTPTAGNVYFWNFGDGATDTVPNPIHSYSIAGIYPIVQRVTGMGGCMIETLYSVVVESDGVGGGGGGGLESESLGDLISKRQYNKIKNSVPLKPDYSILPVFSKPAPYAAAKSAAVTSSLERFFPENLDVTTIPKITSPTDLTQITLAVDAFSVDFTKNDVSKAVVLAITTESKPYNHTKSICDRFRGAALVSTKTVVINGFKFVEFALQQEDGHIEHSITFAAGKSNGVNSFRLQTGWLISKYEKDDSVFNFQVWATTPGGVEKLTKDILDNMSKVLPLQQDAANFSVPQTYMAKGVRSKELLNIDLVSNRASNDVKVIFIQKINETAATDTLIIPFNITAGSNKFSIPIFDGYEYEGHFYVNDTLTDDVYLADGGWSLDIDNTYTTVNNFKPNNNLNRIYSEDEFPLYRSVKVNAKTNDYISIYKFIKSGQEKADLSKYHSYKFYAEGEGQMKIRLLKESVVKFANQYQTTVTLTPSGKFYQISFDDFTSNYLGEKFDPADVTAVVYTFEMKGVATEFSFYANEQSFSPTVVQSIKALSSKSMSVSPNPATDGKFQLKFASEEGRNLDLVLTDITGRVVYTQPIEAIMGYNSFDIQLPAGVSKSILLVSLGNENVKYSTTKLSVVK